MRNIIFILSLFGLSLNAQYDLTDGNGNTLTNGSGYRLVTAGPVYHATQAPVVSTYAVDTVDFFTYSIEPEGAMTEATDTSFFWDHHNGILDTWQAWHGTVSVEDKVWNGTTYRTRKVRHIGGELYHGAGIVPKISDTLEYVVQRVTIEFDKDFVNMDHGKIPGGFYGTEDEDFVCGAWGDGWTQRGQRQRLQLSTYQYDETNNGFSCPWAVSPDTFRFIPGVPYDLISWIAVRSMDGGTTDDNGLQALFVNGHLKVQSTLTTTSDFDDTRGWVGAVGWSGFAGGDLGDSLDYPRRDCYEYSGEMLIYKDTANSMFGTRDTFVTADTLIYPEIAKGAEYYTDTIIDLASENATMGDGSYHTNYFILIDAGAGNTAQIDFTSGSLTSGQVLRVMDSKTNIGNVLYDTQSTDADLTNTDFGYSQVGRITSTTQYIYIYNGNPWSVGNGGGGTWEADVVFN